LAARQSLRWGILSTANIAKERLVPAMLSAGNAELLAVASRSEEKAEQFANEFNIPRRYGSYESLLQDPDIDAVYIPLPNHLHAEWTIRAAAAGKHVLCEKPAALNEQEAQQMVSACRDHGVVFMEAFAFRCHPQWHRLRDMLQSGYIGDVRNVQARFSISVKSDDIRLNPETGGGALYDLGSYCVNGIRFIMDEEPLEVSGFPQWHANGVDLSMAVNMKFPGGRLAQFNISMEGEYHQSIGITGTKGFIKIAWPFRHPKFFIQRNGTEESVNYELQLDEYKEQIQHFGDSVLSGKPLWYRPEETLANMRVIDAIYRSVKANKVEQISRD
jgi:predicted dehydrogenase